MPRQKRDSPVDDDFDTQAAPKRVKVEKQNSIKSEEKKKQAMIPTSSPPPEQGQVHEFTANSTATIRTSPDPKKSQRPAVDHLIEDEEENINPHFGRSKSNRKSLISTKNNHIDKSTKSGTPKSQTPIPKAKGRANKRNREDPSEEDCYVENPSIHGGSSSGEENEITTLDREDIEEFLTREKAGRLATAVKVPVDSNMSEEEKNLYLGLALRGIKPVMSFTWSRDFSTLPESLFAVPDNSDYQEARLAFKTQKGTDFAAIKAFRELLEVGGFVRDCRLLTLKPQVVIQRFIKKYIRWAINDAGLKIAPKALSVHVIYTQRSGQTALSAVTGLSNKMERLAERHQKLHSDFYFVRNLTHTEQPTDSEHIRYWPTLVGFLLCGPIMTIVSLNTDPNSVVWSEKANSRVKYLGQFDMSETDQDVWNSLAIAIAVISMRKSLARLADEYSGPHLPRFRHPDDGTDDEDL
ncbi:uncharacterized protein N7498_000948 [Penicillium cinerascens]|uniref:Uncharacterized protein n=1 Tax=Penicillium cinerascens TaxID=70096 RepID=A0A9W9NF94_9EURO|nr:uncharacterized protein N7498_000948 [Penicillium cinerascens]KAJ5218849.1 hypothetical protein N7498_000948 [Penicillium cinerascens]